MEETRFKQERLLGIVSDQHHGAAELGREALQVLADYSVICAADQSEEFIAKLCAYAAELQHARPSMMPLRNLLEQWCDRVRKLSRTAVDNIRGQAIDYAYDLIRQSRTAVGEIARHTAALVPAGSVIITHSMSSTVVECFRRLAGKNVTAIITESRPGDEGKALAQQLVECAITAHYITDAQMGLFVSQADLVLVGADSILADGSAVNKAGTYLLALAADNLEVPFYVCAETFKKTSNTKVEVELEEKSGEELSLPTLPHITPRNIYFDITPPALITGWINENGLETVFYNKKS